MVWAYSSTPSPLKNYRGRPGLRAATPYQGLLLNAIAEDDEAVAWASKPPIPCPLQNARLPSSPAANASASDCHGALAQETDILLLDEPTPTSTRRNQVELLDLLSDSTKAAPP